MSVTAPSRSKPVLELLGERDLDKAVTTALAREFRLRRLPGNGSAAHAVMIVASGPTFHDTLGRVRRRTDAPTVLLLREAAVSDRVRALEAGADDVLVAPFDASEVLARLRAVMRRAVREAPPVLRIDDLDIDVAQRVVRRGDRVVELSRTELALLTSLARHEGAVVSHDRLTREVWGSVKSITTVHTFVSYLRAKLHGPGEKPLIRTVRGVGYALHPSRVPAPAFSNRR